MNAVAEPLTAPDIAKVQLARRILEERPAPPPPEPSPFQTGPENLAEDLVTITRAAAYLGVAVSTVHQYCRHADLPHYRLRHANHTELAFFMSELASWQRRKTLRRLMR